MSKKPFAAPVTALAFVVACASVGACAAGGFVTADGYNGVYVAGPPANINAYPRYRFRGGYVYDVRGRYYHPYRGRWVTYRTMPREAVRERSFR